MRISPWKLLLIDDDAGVRKVLSIALEDEGYSIVTAPDGETGLLTCKEMNPHIIITDVRMPGIDGIEVLRRIKAMDSEKEVIVVTAFSEIELAVQALQLGASDFITKPINEDALMVALERAKERYSNRKELRDYASMLEEKWLKTADELAKTFNFQKILIDGAIDGIIACDEEGKIIIFNKSMEQILGCLKEDAIGRMSFNDFFTQPEIEKFKAKLYSDEYGGKNRLFLFETVLTPRSGARIPVQMSAVVLFEEGKEIGLVGFFRDLRDIRKLMEQVADQARLLHQDKMISLGKLAASVVHEINNPIAGIINYTRLMLKILGKGPLSPESAQKFQGYLSIMESELSRCSKIVSNLLAFSRKSKLEFGQVKVNELLQKCISLSEYKLTLQNIAINAQLGSDVPEIIGDANQLQQCFINLILNAIDAMPTGGAIGIASSYDSGRNLVDITVSDTGCGIAKEDLPYIFDPFFTTKTEGKGLGLGLSTVFGIVDRHKGTIKAESEPGKGSKFHIKLPVKA